MTEQDDLPLEFEKSDLPEHVKSMIRWLQGFQYTKPYQRWVAAHKFSPEELAYLRASLKLIPKKQGVDMTKYF